MAAPHPAQAHAAGLASAEAHIAHDRWDPVKGSQDYTQHDHVNAQPVLPIPSHKSTNYSNTDIAFSVPSNRPLLATSGLPRTFKPGSRCVNPLEPRYVLPGTTGFTRDSPGAGSPAASPKAGAGACTAPWAVDGSPSPSRAGSTSQRLPALTVSRGGEGSGAASPKPFPMASPSAAPAAASPGANPAVSTLGAVGGLLLYGPAAAAAGNRSLDVSDINGPRRSTSVPPRRNGAFDPLYTTDIVPPRKASPARAMGSLTTGDIRGAGVRSRTRDVPSPGRGTLNSADISGAAPGCLTRASPTTYALGRWPAPAVPHFQFNIATRVTAVKKPLTIGD